MAKFIWFAPTTGDGSYLGNLKLWQPHDVHYATNVCCMAEEGGMDGVLFPVGSNNLDPWIVATNTATKTKRIELIVAARPDNQQPLVLAQLARSLDQVSNGRTSINIVTGGFTNELKKYGDEVEDKEERYLRTEEFSELIVDLWTKDSVTKQGAYYSLESAAVVPKPTGQERPKLYLSGNSASALDISARFYDYYLFGGQKMENTIKMTQRLHEVSSQHTSAVRPAITFDVIARPTDAEAWERAHDLVSKVSREQQIRLALYKRAQSAKGNTMLEALEQANYLLEEHVWAGLFQARFGASACLVGSYEAISDILQKYIEHGVEAFFVRGYPYKDELERFTTHVLPRVR
ncbi:LLM class flavin-dependent oxidoreductase [Alicyclobacillus fodiniaquatilis]|uniref:LLM class flavin-dependent oxidoreductase n=1 Tax=Alicyclobacillus fodiniaquatilis TaxID=1661150 RepID=A0ABW4JCD9_9BACL